MAQLRTLLTGLLERLDAGQLDQDDLFALGMVSMVVNSNKSTKHTPSDDSAALRCLALGWLVDSMMHTDANQPKNDN